MGIHADERSVAGTWVTKKEEGLEESSCPEEELLSQHDQEGRFSARLQLVKFNPRVVCGCAMLAAIGILILLVWSLTVLGTQKLPKSGPPDDAGELPTCDYNKSVLCSAWTLFENSDVHWVATENLMHIGDELFGEFDIEQVQADVAVGFHGIAAELQHHTPVVVRDLNAFKLSRVEAQAVMKSLWALSTPGVQKLGSKIAQVINQIPSTATTADLKVSIEDSLKSHLGEIESLTIGTVPQQVRKLWGAQGRQHEWELTLSPRNIRLMRSTNSASISADTCDYSSMDRKTRALVIFVAVLEVGKVFMELLKAHIVSEGFSWDNTPRDVIDRLFDGIHLPANSNDFNCMEALLWPLRCGVQGIDAMRAATDFIFNQDYKG